MRTLLSLLVILLATSSIQGQYTLKMTNKKYPERSKHFEVPPHKHLKIWANEETYEAHDIVAVEPDSLIIDDGYKIVAIPLSGITQIKRKNGNVFEDQRSSYGPPPVYPRAAVNMAVVMPLNGHYYGGRSRSVRSASRSSSPRTGDGKNVSNNLQSSDPQLTTILIAAVLIVAPIIIIDEISRRVNMNNWDLVGVY